MNTTVWVVLTLGLALLAVSGWRLAKFFERRAMIERYMGLHVTRWLTSAENALIEKDEEICQLRREVAKLRVRKHNASQPRYDLEAIRAAVATYVCSEKFFPALAKTEDEHNWRVYLRREQAIREMARLRAWSD
jgi:hypothetical protein